MSETDKRICKKKECDKCICITCMHQGFDCDCSLENRKAVHFCEDYDEMQGEQLRLDFL